MFRYRQMTLTGQVMLNRFQMRTIDSKSACLSALDVSLLLN